ncbi:MAG: branched-chain amino acid ABC transporter permease [Deltaproteobacteria bacterium]|nr:branched-chain amino acid ABC transporter permease [Deltaproteobacteria bacterium]
MPANITFWVQMGINCIVLGGLLLLIAIGLNIIYGINRVINLAHGSLYALGAYFGYSLVSSGLNFFLALLIAPVMVAIVGVIIERMVIAPIRTRPMLYSLILTYGLMVFLDGILKYIWGDQIHFIEIPDFLSETIKIAGIPYPFYRFFILITTVAVMACLMFLLEKTKIGMTMRAASNIPEMVSALGINMNFVYMIVFALGCVLAGIGGVIAGPLLTVYPMMGGEMLISCFVVLVIGGLGSLRGVTIAALLVGVVQTLGYVFITDYAMVVVYVMMALILIFMPRGILGEGKFE